MALLKSFLHKTGILEVRAAAAFIIVFFIVMAFLTTFAAIPQINKILKNQSIQESQTALDVEAELLERFVAHHRSILSDLAQFPVVISAALLSRSENTDFTDLLDNFSMQGLKSNIVMHNIEGQVIYQTYPNMTAAVHSDAEWLLDILTDKIPYHFALLSQKKDRFTFLISVPVLYQGRTEGVLSKETEVPMRHVFSKASLNHKSAVKLRQGGVVIQTDSSNIVMPREISKSVLDNRVELSFINDETDIITAQQALNNKLLAFLISGMVISFGIFVLLGYRILKQDGDIQDRKSWRDPVYAVPLLLAIVGGATSFFIAYVIFSIEQENLRNEKRYTAQEIVFNINQQIGRNMVALDALKAFFDGSTEVSRQEFSDFTAPLLRNSPDIQAFQWLPKVKNEKRAYFKEKAKKDGLDFEIRVPDYSNPNKVYVSAASDREVYFPVFYLEPYAGNEKVLGLDAYNNDSRQKAIAQAIATGKPSATKPIRLVQETEKEYGVLVLNPVYKKDASTKDVLGLVQIVFRLSNTVDYVLQSTGKQSSKQNLLIQDITNPQDILNIYGSELSGFETPHILSQRLNVAGREWQITALDSQKGFYGYSVIPILAFVAGVAFTFFITYRFIQLIQRRQEIEEIVQRRTKQIQEANAELEEFSYRTSHDLRSPLVSSIRLIDFAKKSIEQREDAKALEALTHSQNSLKSLEILVKDILRLSQTKEAPEEARNVSPTSLIEDALLSLNYMENFERLDIQKNLEFEGEIRTKVLRLSLIIENLLSNAIKYQDTQKQSSFLRITTKQLGDDFILEVLDNGMGIPHNQEHKLFEMFKRFHPKTSFGSGLGLYMVKKSADIIKGTISYEKTSEGTLFKLIISDILKS